MISEQNNIYESIFESNKDLFWMVDPIDFGLVVYNSALFNYFETGRNLKIHKGMTPEHLLPKDKADQWKKMYTKALVEGSYITEYQTSAKSRILNLSFNLVHRDGKLIGISVMSQDITDRKLSEKRAFNSNLLYSTILNNPIFAAIVINDDGTIDWINSTGLKFLEIDSENSIIGRLYSDIFVVDGQDIVLLLSNQMYIDAKEYRIRINTNVEKTILLSATRIILEDNTFSVLTFIDISVLKETELQLIKSEKRFETMLATIPAGIFLTSDNHTQIQYLSTYFTELFGYTKKDLPSIVDWFEKAYPDVAYRETVIKETSEKFEESVKDQTYKTEMFSNVTCLDGSVKYIFWQGFLVDGLWMGCGFDMTKIKEFENQLSTQINLLRDSMSQNQRILDNLQDAYFQTDMKGNFTVINKQALNMYRYESETELLGHPAEMLYFIKEDCEKLVKELRMKGMVSDFVCLGERKDSTHFSVSMNVQYVKDINGSVLGTEGVVRDISERVSLMDQIRSQRDRLLEVNKSLESMFDKSVRTISKISELRDPYTAGHQTRVSCLACLIAKQLGMNDEDIMHLSYGAKLHDLGKIQIASEILNKPGTITNLEYQIIQTHAEHGYNIVKEVGFPDVIPTMIVQHHERLDGSGYPFGLKGEQIILESRILAVADVVEAMASHRPYRPALGFEKAISEIVSGRGSKYDERVVDACEILLSDKNFDFDDQNCNLI